MRRDVAVVIMPADLFVAFAIVHAIVVVGFRLRVILSQSVFTQVVSVLT